MTDQTDIAVSKHFVTFYSPGTFVAEQTSQPIDSWDIDTAVEMAKSIVERYNARPYGFRFSTRGRTNEDLDSKVVEESSFYWIGGRVETLEEIQQRNDPSERILRSNMEINRWTAVVTNENSWRWTQPLKEGDVVLDVELGEAPK